MKKKCGLFYLLVCWFDFVVFDGGNLCDIYGGIGEEICCWDFEFFGDLFFSWVVKVVDICVFGFDFVGVEVGDCGDIGMCCWVVIVFIVVIGENFLVVVVIYFLGVVEYIVVKVVGWIMFLCVDVFKVVFLSYFWSFFFVKVYLDEVVDIDVGVDVEEVVFGFIKVRYVLVVRGFSKFVVEVIWLVMVLVWEYEIVVGVFCDDREGVVFVDVVEGVNFVFVVLVDNEFEFSEFVVDLVVRFGDFVFVCSYELFFGKDRVVF